MAQVYENFEMQDPTTLMGESLYQNVSPARSQPEKKPKIADKPKPAKPTKPSKSGGPKSYKYLVALDIGQSTMGYAIAPADKPREFAQLKNWAASYNYTAFKAPSVACLTEQETKIGLDGFKMFCDTYGSEYEADGGALAARFSRNTKIPVSKSIFKETLKELLEVALTAVRDTYNVGVDIKEVKLILVRQCKNKGKDNETKKMKQLIEVVIKEYQIIEKINAAFIYCNTIARGSPVPETVLVINAGGSNIQLASYVKSDDTDYTRRDLESTGFGANRINRYFVGFISDQFEKGFVEHCKKECPGAWLELMDSFEQCKKGAAPETSISYSLELNLSLSRAFEGYHKMKIDEHLKGNKDLSITKGWKLRLSDRVMKTFYANITTEIEQKITQMKAIIFCDPDQLFLVGGFADSKYMQETVRRLFPEVRMIIPENPDVCALKGALFAEERFSSYSKLL